MYSHGIALDIVTTTSGLSKKWGAGPDETLSSTSGDLGPRDGRRNWIRSGLVHSGSSMSTIERAIAISTYRENERYHPWLAMDMLVRYHARKDVKISNPSMGLKEDEEDEYEAEEILYFNEES